MKSTLTEKTVAIYGHNWSLITKRLIEVLGIFQKKPIIFEYSSRERMFSDQYDIFIITDFSKSPQNSLYFRELDLLRQIIYTRSRQTVIFANDDDIDISKSVREASARVVRYQPKGDLISKSVAKAIISEFLAIKTQENIVLAA